MNNRIYRLMKIKSTRIIIFLMEMKINKNIFLKSNNNNKIILINNKILIKNRVKLLMLIYKEENIFQKSMTRIISIKLKKILIMMRKILSIFTVLLIFIKKKNY